MPDENYENYYFLDRQGDLWIQTPDDTILCLTMPAKTNPKLWEPMEVLLRESEIRAAVEAKDEEDKQEYELEITKHPDGSIETRRVPKKPGSPPAGTAAVTSITGTTNGSIVNNGLTLPDIKVSRQGVTFSSAINTLGVSSNEAYNNAAAAFNHAAEMMRQSLG